MQIKIRDSGQMVYENEFRAMFPNTSFPQQLSEELLNDLGADVVFEGPQASGGTVYQYSVRQGEEQIDGKWYTKHVLGPVFTDTTATEETPAKTAAENETAYKASKDAEQAKSIRSTRDTKLAETDWRYRRDLTTTPEWDAYCQALRDITIQEGFPWTINWPEAP